MSVEQGYRVRVPRVVGGGVDGRERIRGLWLGAMLRVEEGFAMLDLVRRGLQEESWRVLVHVNGS